MNNDLNHLIELLTNPEKANDLIQQASANPSILPDSLKELLTNPVKLSETIRIFTGLGLDEANDLANQLIENPVAASETIQEYLKNPDFLKKVFEELSKQYN